MATRPRIEARRNSCSITVRPSPKVAAAYSPGGDGGYYTAYGLATLHTNFMERIMKPGECMLLFDATIKDVNGFPSDSANYNNIYFNPLDKLIKNKHLGGFTLLYVDGHVGKMKSKYEVTVNNFDGYSFEVYPY